MSARAGTKVKYPHSPTELHSPSLVAISQFHTSHKPKVVPPGSIARVSISHNEECCHDRVPGFLSPPNTG